MKMVQNVNVPTVITKQLLINLVIAQGPQDQVGKFFQENEIKLEDIDKIRIEHNGILHICNLWMMKNLTKLSLCNNVIEKIENLNELVCLKELDLSFNRIDMIENLENLVELEILSLYSNQIAEVKGLDQLHKLQIFSIGKNLIGDWNHVLYLRKFKSLCSLNTSDNPCAESDGYFNYVVAFIPQLIYLRYKMISEEERKSAKEKYHREITSLEEKESSENEKLMTEQELQKRNFKLQNAFMEYLDGNRLFEEMFENDTGHLFFNINKNSINLYENYKTSFCEICTELVNFGLSEDEKRSNELKLLNDALEKGKVEISNHQRMLVDRICEKKNTFFINLVQLLNELTERNIENNLGNIEEMVEKITRDIIEIVKEEWYNLMKKEVTLHQQILNTIETFRINILDMANNFTQTSENRFDQLMNIEIEFNINLRNLITTLVNDYKENHSEIPPNLTILCEDEVTTDNTLKTMLNMHLQIIKSRKDELISKIKSWIHNLIEELVNKETERYKSRVLEISQVLNFQDHEYECLQQCGDPIVRDLFEKIVYLLIDDELTSFTFYNNSKI